jgi:hypothetical protein
MGDPAPVEVDPAVRKLELARERVSTIADGLATQTTIKPFEEKMGAVDYQRW